MKLSEPYKNQDTGKTEINILGITTDEIVWLRTAVKAYQDKGDQDDFKMLAHARDWMDTVHQAFKKVRPS